jgi:hypothetical protein
MQCKASAACGTAVRIVQLIPGREYTMLLPGNRGKASTMAAHLFSCHVICVFKFGFPEIAKASRKAAHTRLIDKHAPLTGALAVVLYAPVSAMADTPGLADHQIGRRQARF